MIAKKADELGRHLRLRVSQVMRVLDEIRNVHPNAGTNTVLAFLTIATKPGITVGDLQKTLGFLATSTARSLAAMLKNNRGKPGLDLIDQRPDLYDRRIRHLFLTPRGERLWRNVREHLEKN